ncbi:hypothetical protein X907_0731 [Glycocaulis alkaliphilus]|uniref:Uncharacterized protein n=1 Tax=Glycocaulis alkaliphilus TaxID=1434191 RepID=A0A3T0E782_9PROT|nr:DUF2254 domain-containing protein [Glycocaulis alkaliphilus]AZU03275.1 hypothetical protein X907_0731 [Glycocaulis alkaliphilus]GGB72346.1 hypothetical protein GCM10007417_10240 [Glycocaulis alkaliphilus]
MERIKLLISRITGSLWFLPALYAAGAIVLVFAAPLTRFIVPDALAELIEEEALRTILNVLSSSLLAVTIFSLTTMATSLKAVSDAATPRARPILIKGGGAQNAIATFLGAFIFSMIGLVALNSGMLGGGGATMLFALTGLATLMVVIVLIQWIRQLSTLGDVEDAISKVEAATRNAFRTLACLPPSAGQSALGKAKPYALRAERPGYVQMIDLPALEDTAKRLDVRVEVLAIPGDRCGPALELARVYGADSAKMAQKLLPCFVRGSVRTLEADPRLGLTALSEIGSRALSPGINDPGTAISAVRALERCFAGWCEVLNDAGDREALSRVVYPGLDAAEALREPVIALARDGAAQLEVMRALGQLCATASELDGLDLGKETSALKAEIVERASTAMAHKSDIVRLKEAIG